MALLEGSAGSIDEVYELYPWRVGDAPTVEVNKIGDPIFTLSDDLKKNEIWLEGQELPIAKYKKLYKVYGTRYGQASNAQHFLVPNFIDRSIWGIKSTDNFGYISGALPNIVGNFRGVSDCNNASGPFKVTATSWYEGQGDGEDQEDINFDASRCSDLYKNDINYVQPTSVAVKVKTRYR